MKKYHYSDGDKQFGPLTKEELKDKKITKDTMVWYEGLDNWVKASDVDELKELFKSTPPPLDSIKQTPPPINVKTEQKPNPAVTNVKPKKNKTGLTIGLIGGVIGIAFIVFFVINNNHSSNGGNNQNNGSNTYNSSSNNSITESANEQNTYTPPPPKKKTEEELKRELANTECSNPVKYLKMNNKDLTGVYKNVLSMKFNGFKVKFNVHNAATIVTFKNVKCRVTLSSNSGSTILSKNFTVNEFIRAGSNVSYKGEFECTNQQFKDTDRYSIEILGAECH